MICATANLQNIFVVSQSFIIAAILKASMRCSEVKMRKGTLYSTHRLITWKCFELSVADFKKVEMKKEVCELDGLDSTIHNRKYHYNFDMALRQIQVSPRE